MPGTEHRRTDVLDEVVAALRECVSDWRRPAMTRRQAIDAIEALRRP